MTSRRDPYDWTQPTERLLFVRWFLGISLFATLSLTYPLFTAAGRSLPLVPLVPVLSIVSIPFDWVVLALLFSSTLLFCLAPSAVGTTLFVALIGLLSLQDQNRFQSWLLFYALMLGAYIPSLRAGASKWTTEQTLQLLRGITWATCLWSGVQKCVPDFFFDTVPSMASSLVGQGAWLESPTRWVLSLLPVCEVLGALLLIPRTTRSCGVILLVAANLVLLVAVGPIGITWHRCGWPWLMALIVIIPRLFWSSKTSASQFLNPPSMPSKALFWVICLVLPALGFFGRWDPYLSFGLFSGRADASSVVVEQTAFDQLPKVIRQAAEQVDAEGYYRIQIQHWSEIETGAPPSARAEILRLDAQMLCRLIAPKEPLLVGIEHPGEIPWVSPQRMERLSCEGMMLLPMPEKEDEESGNQG